MFTTTNIPRYKAISKPASQNGVPVEAYRGFLETL